MRVESEGGQGMLLGSYLGGWLVQRYIEIPATYGYIGPEIKNKKLQVHVETMPLQLDFIPFRGAMYCMFTFYLVPTHHPSTKLQTDSGLLPAMGLCCSWQWLLPFWKSYS